MAVIAPSHTESLLTDPDYVGLLFEALAPNACSEPSTFMEQHSGRILAKHFTAMSGVCKTWQMAAAYYLVQAVRQLNSTIRPSISRIEELGKHTSLALAWSRTGLSSPVTFEPWPISTGKAAPVAALAAQWERSAARRMAEPLRGPAPLRVALPLQQIEVAKLGQQ